MIFNIAEMTREHTKKLAELEKVCFSTPWSESGLNEEIENSQSHFIVAENESDILGYIGVQEIWGEAYITNIAVFPKYRRQGVAQMLLQRAIDGAKSRDCVFITLEVRKSNLNAIALYNKFDFKNVGERKNFYTNPTENAIIMTKNFN